jgi:hypothetical protein
MEHFIIIRFSVLFKNRPFEERKYNETFLEDRLESRFKFFEMFCLKSLINQTIKDFKIILLYDQLLPEKYKEKLFNLTKNYDYIILHLWNKEDQLEENNWLQQYIDKSKKYLITTRFDDDDLLNFQINEKLKEFINKNNLEKLKNSIVSFSGGKFIYVSEDIKTFKISECNYKNPSIFLSLITDINSSNNIYFQSHHDIKIKLRILKMINAWGQINYSKWHLDDTRSLRMGNKYKNKMEEITLEKIYKTFLEN